MARKSPSLVNYGGAFMWGLAAGIACMILISPLTDGGAVTFWIVLLNFIVWPLLSLSYESKLPERKLQYWTDILSQGDEGNVRHINATEGADELSGRIEISSTWRGIPVHWSLPSPLILGHTSKGSLISFKYGQDIGWPDTLKIQWNESHSTVGSLKLDGPEDYLAACLTPDLRDRLNSLCEQYGLKVIDGRIEFDLRYTARATEDQDIEKEIDQFMEIARSLTIPASEIPERVITQYESRRASLHQKSGRIIEEKYETDLRVVEELIRTLVLFQGSSQAAIGVIQKIMSEGSLREQMVVSTAVLHRSNQGEDVPVNIMEDAHTFMTQIFDTMNTDCAPFTEGIDAYLGYLGQDQGRSTLARLITLVSTLTDEVAEVTAVLLKYSQIWHQWPDAKHIRDMLECGVLDGQLGQDILRSLKSMCADAEDQVFLDDVATACLETRPPLSETRSVHSYALELDLLTWIRNHGSLSIVGPLEDFADSAPTFGFSFSGSEIARAERLEHEARQSRSALIERYGDGGGRLSMLRHSSNGEGGHLSLSKDDATQSDQTEKRKSDN